MRNIARNAPRTYLTTALVTVMFILYVLWAADLAAQPEPFVAISVGSAAMAMGLLRLIDLAQLQAFVRCSWARWWYGRGVSFLVIAALAQALLALARRWAQAELGSQVVERWRTAKRSSGEPQGFSFSRFSAAIAVGAADQRDTDRLHCESLPKGAVITHNQACLRMRSRKALNERPLPVLDFLAPREAFERLHEREASGCYDRLTLPESSWTRQQATGT